MIKTVQRLEFENVFPEEQQKDILEYLGAISKFLLLDIIGFSNTVPQFNFDNFFNNQDVQWDVIQRVTKYCKKNNIAEPPEVVSREASLRLAEIILTNRETLLEGNRNDDKDADEINIFKAFLIINKEVNVKQNFGNEKVNIDKMADMLITLSFSSADIGLYSNTDLEFGKLLYTTIFKFEFLLSFLSSSEDYKYLEKALYRNFKEENIEGLNAQVKLFLGTVLKMKFDNSYKLVPAKSKHLRFLNTLASAKIDESEDFTNLKNYPLYKVDDATFSIIDYFFAVDKFFKSVRFILKDAFNSHHNLQPRDGSFFSFFNTKFSEEFLMKRVLDDVFHKKYIVKRQEAETKDNEPDYYARHNNRIYLFENKDILVAAGIKSSSDIDEIRKLLKNKFLKDGSRAVGIGQLVKSIEQIVNNQFPFDDYVNNKNNLTIYPILLVSDRIFEVMGMNFILNQWYLELVREKLGEQYNPSIIRDLTFIDMDTLIYWLPHLKKKDSNLKDIIDSHHKAMKKVANINTPNIQEGILQANKSFYNRLSPISNRFSEYKFPFNLLVDKFREVLPK
ncbi:MAG: hypothetical protein KBT58_07915 [Bizionia sp.]|nr:hypothetical protein [Bizionia sp.]